MEIKSILFTSVRLVQEKALKGLKADASEEGQGDFGRRGRLGRDLAFILLIVKLCACVILLAFCIIESIFTHFKIQTVQ